MLKQIMPVLVALLADTVLVPGAALAADTQPGAAVSRPAERTEVRHITIRRHRVRRLRRAYRTSVFFPGLYFYCPPRQAVCQLTPRLVWTPAGYRRVWYVRERW